MDFILFLLRKGIYRITSGKKCVYVLARESIDSEEQQRVKALEHISTRTDQNHSETSVTSAFFFFCNRKNCNRVKREANNFIFIRLIMRCCKSRVSI